MRRQKRAETAHLSHKDVVQAALHIIDHDGLGGLSMRKLGTHLGVDPMAIYYYFPNKQAVLDGIMEAVMSEMTIPDTLGPSWVEDLRTLLREFRRVLQAHPYALPVVTSHPMRTPAGLQLVETTLRILRSAGFSPQETVDAVVNLGPFVMGHVLTDGKAPGGSEPTLSQAEITANVTDQYPILQEVLQSGITYDPDMQFEHGLDLFLLGLQAQRKKQIG